MIISEKYKYLFIQFPHTACTAVGEELIKNYGGRQILFKHAKYHHFIKYQVNNSQQYYVFSSIRNPLDEMISIYYKFYNDHEDYSNPLNWQENGGWLSSRGRQQFQKIYRERATFEEYMLNFYKLPYVNWSVIAHKKFDFIIRYESLQSDFSKLLDILGIEQVRPLPLLNNTDRVIDEPIFNNVDFRKKLVWILGPLMQYWGYKFPADWTNASPSAASKLAFHFNKAARSFYWRYIAS